VKISVVMPVYNAERYLEQSINSVVNQSFTSWELICVDDGSTDNSGVLLNRLAQADKRIRVLNQENAGVTAARYKGVQASTGDYIFFFDSDDVLHPDALSSLADAASRYGADIACQSYKKVGADWVMSSGNEQPIPKKKYKLSNNPYRDVCNKNISIMVWGKLFHKKLFSGFEWPDISFAEDLYMTLCLIEKADRVFYAKDRVVYYRQHPGSSTKKFSLKKLDEVFDSVALTLGKLSSSGRADLKSVKRYIAKYQIFSLFTLVQGTRELEERFVHRLNSCEYIGLADFTPLRALQVWLFMHGYERSLLLLRSTIKKLKV